MDINRRDYALKTHKSFTITWCAEDNEIYKKNVKAMETFRDTFGYKRLIAAHEVAKTGTKHIQGGIVFSSGRTLKTVMNKFPGAHIEVMISTWDRTVDYCTKECEPFIHVVRTFCTELDSTDFYWINMLD